LFPGTAKFENSDGNDGNGASFEVGGRGTESGSNGRTSEDTFSKDRPRTESRDDKHGAGDTMKKESATALEEGRVEREQNESAAYPLPSKPSLILTCKLTL
jgi:hypothetical protein